MLLYLIVDHLMLHMMLLLLRLFQFVQDSAYNQTFELWFVVRKFSEDLALSIGSFQKVQLEVI